MHFRPQGLIGGMLLERRAGRIQDPIDKLRYLRRATVPHTSLEVKLAWARSHWKTLLLLLVFFVLRVHTASDSAVVAKPHAPLARPVGRETPPAPVWLVEKTKDFEVYSNGLRIEKRYATSNTPRRYLVFEPGSAEPLSTDWQTEPAGIVFHSTESELAPFEAEQNGALKRVTGEVLEFIRRNRSYHYVIDRFGRVFRVVEETDAANHAGKSIWADSRGLYVNLNSSFLGVSFEAQTRDEQGRASINRAQIQAGRILTEVLRSRYRIPMTNCVTHAQVSVNPDNMRIGYHTDWADNFPYQEIGLPDNYAQPVPSLYAFGFGYDTVYVKQSGARLWKGLLLAEEQVRQEAAAHGVTVAQHRAGLQQRYLETIAALRSRSASQEMESR